MELLPIGAALFHLEKQRCGQMDGQTRQSSWSLFPIFLKAPNNERLFATVFEAFKV